MKLKKFLAVATAVVMTLASTMTVFGASTATAGDLGLTDEEFEIYEKSDVSDKVSAKDENGNELVTVALDYEKIDKEASDELIGWIDKNKAPGEVVALYEVQVGKDGQVIREGKVTLTFQVDGVKPGDKVTVVHYLTDAEGMPTGEVEYITPDSVGNGTVTATFTSLSPVAVVVQFVKAEPKPVAKTPAAKTPVKTAAKTTAKKSPKTGNSDYAMMVVLSAAALGVLAYTGRKTKRA